jgi:hypothetical protein
MDPGAGAHYSARTAEEVFRDFRGRRAGMIKALTNGMLPSLAPLFRISLAYLAASPVLTYYLVWWFAQMWRSSTSCATPVSLLDLLGAADSHFARVRAFGRPAWCPQAKFSTRCLEMRT